MKLDPTESMHANERGWLDDDGSRRKGTVSDTRRILDGTVTNNVSFGKHRQYLRHRPIGHRLRHTHNQIIGIELLTSNDSDLKNII